MQFKPHVNRYQLGKLTIIELEALSIKVEPKAEIKKAIKMFDEIIAAVSEYETVLRSKTRTKIGRRVTFSMSKNEGRGNASARK